MNLLQVASQCLLQRQQMKHGLAAAAPEQLQANGALQLGPRAATWFLGQRLQCRVHLDLAEAKECTCSRVCAIDVECATKTTSGQCISTKLECIMNRNIIFGNDEVLLVFLPVPEVPLVNVADRMGCRVAASPAPGTAASSPNPCPEQLIKLVHVHKLAYFRTTPRWGRLLN